MTEPPTKKSATWYVASQGIYGETTQHLKTVWTSLLGETAEHVPDHQVQRLFHQLDLYPSQSQVFEMIHCSRESCVASFQTCDTSDLVPSATTDEGAGAAAKNYLTFGEFCLFATELRRKYDQHEAAKQPAAASDASSAGSSSSCSLNKSPDSRSQKSASTTSAYDVFLGGSCNPTTWRTDTAIPFLKSKGITYYNPQQPNWVPEMIELEHQAKQTSKVLLFVISNQTRNVVSLIEVAYLAGGSMARGRRLVLCMEQFPTSGGHRIGDEEVSCQELSDLTSGLITVQDLVERQEIPVFDALDVALSCTSKMIQDNLTADQLTLKDSAQPVRHAHLQVGDKVLRMREAFSTLDTQQTGRISLTELKMAFRVHTHRDLSQKDIRAIVRAQDASRSEKSVSRQTCDQIKLDFDAFCCIVAEFKPQASKGPKKKTFFSISKTLGHAYKAIFGSGSTVASSRPLSSAVRPAGAAAPSATSTWVARRPAPSTGAKRTPSPFSRRTAWPSSGLPAAPSRLDGGGDSCPSKPRPWTTLACCCSSSRAVPAAWVPSAKPPTILEWAGAAWCCAWKRFQMTGPSTAPRRLASRLSKITTAADRTSQISLTAKAFQSSNQSPKRSSALFKNARPTTNPNYGAIFRFGDNRNHFQNLKYM